MERDSAGPDVQVSQRCGEPSPGHHVFDGLLPFTRVSAAEQGPNKPPESASGFRADGVELAVGVPVVQQRTLLVGDELANALQGLKELAVDLALVVVGDCSLTGLCFFGG